jgi:hypothetical protein
MVKLSKRYTFDHWGEYIPFHLKFSIVQGILHQFIIPYTPKQYGIVKWKDQTLVEVA